MGGIEVASVVVSIISAFSSGMDVFYRLGGKKRKSRARPPRPWEEEEWAQESLKTRPLQIKHEYDQSVVTFGRRFEVGDSAAHSSLAHTLLVLNTGLINLINQALAADPKSRVMSRKALFNLSEAAASDTMTALDQLKTRLSFASQSRLQLEPNLKENQRADDRKRHRQGRRTSSKSPSKTDSRPSPTPLLAHGGWVRSRSGTSIVPGIAIKKAREAKEAKTVKHSSSNSELAAVDSSPSQDGLHTHKQSGIESTEDSKWSHRPGNRPSREPTTSRDHNSDEDPSFRRPASQTESRPQRPPSMLIVPADFFDTHVTAKQSPGLRPPPRPPKIPLDSRPRPRSGHQNARPTSTMTFMTASTKIGEIPESRWSDRVDAAQDLSSRSPPYPSPPLVERNEPKRRNGLKFWKREGKGRDPASW